MNIEDDAIDSPTPDLTTLSEGAVADMPHEAKRVLVQLMRQGVISAAQKPKVFELICRHQSHIRRHLAEVFLRLSLDEKGGLAFVSIPDEEISEDTDIANDDMSPLISKRTLSLYDTLLLLVLRKHYQEREATGEQKITIDIEKLEFYLMPFLPLSDHASLDQKRLLARVKEMVKRKILYTLRGVEERYEISPVIRYVVNAAFLEGMLEEYQCLANNLGLDDDANND